MHTPIEAFESLAKELGVEVELEVEVEEIVVGDDGLAKGLKVRSGRAKDLKTLAQLNMTSRLRNCGSLASPPSPYPRICYRIRSIT